MTVNEANQRLTTTQITEETFWKINPLYLLLDLDKDDFCKIVDVIGIDKIAQNCNLYKKSLHALDQQRKKDRYNFLLKRIERNQEETEQLICEASFLRRELELQS